MSDIAVINTENYGAMAQLMGVASAAPAKSKSSTLPRLRIWNQGVKEKDGKRSVEIIPSGYYRLECPDEGKMYFAEKVVVRPFLQRFMYKKYDTASNTYVKTVMHDNLTVDLKDTVGGFNCGKPAGYIQDFNALSDDMKDLIKQIKRVRVIVGEVELINPLQEDGQPADLSVAQPFIWEIDNKSAYKLMAEPFSQMSRQRKLPIQHKITLDTTEQELQTGGSFFLPEPSLDLTTASDITDADQARFANFLEWIENYNKYVFEQWDNNKGLHSSQDETDAVDAILGDNVFIDVDDEDAA